MYFVPSALAVYIPRVVMVVHQWPSIRATVPSSVIHHTILSCSTCGPSLLSRLGHMHQC